MPQYDFNNNEYSPIRDVEQRATIRKARGWEKEWRVISYDGNQVRLQSATHDDDVELIITGNFTKVQKWRLAEELCAQLNKAELDAAKEFDENTEPPVRQTNFVDPDGANMFRKVIFAGHADEGNANAERDSKAEGSEPRVQATAGTDRQHNDPAEA